MNSSILDELLSNPLITEVMVNGPNEIYIEEQGQLKLTSYRFPTEDHLRSLIEQWVAQVGRRVDNAAPICDFRLEDGSRVNVVLPPLSLQGPVVTIRRFRKSLLSCQDLINTGTLGVHHPAILMALVQQRRNIIVTGNTASGKTTLLNMVSGFIDDQERIVTLEDAAELRLQKPHVVRLETRSSNAEGKGAIEMKDLVINALRMRPDRIIVGECRGAEIIPMLQALNTGHSGSMTTLHSNSARDALHRLESLVLSQVPDWPLDAIRQQIGSAIHVIVHLNRVGSIRRLEEIVSVRFDGVGFQLDPLV